VLPYLDLRYTATAYASRPAQIVARELISSREQA
jgi:hypothetical protein